MELSLNMASRYKPLYESSVHPFCICFCPVGSPLSLNSNPSIIFLVVFSFPYDAIELLKPFCGHGYAFFRFVLILFEIIMLSASLVKSSDHPCIRARLYGHEGAMLHTHCTQLGRHFPNLATADLGSSGR